MKKYTNELNRAFSKAEVQMTKNYTVPGHKGNANQNHIPRFHITPVRTAIIKNTKN
jgi:hypothetical protein